MISSYRHDAARTSQTSGPRRRVLFVLTVLAGTALGVSACTSSPAVDPDRAASAVVSSLGTLPIPTSPAVEPTPTASPGRPQVLAIGAPVAVQLDASTTVTAVATGPQQAITEPTSTKAGDEQTPATITLTVTAAKGSTHVSAADVICRDESGNAVPLQPQGPSELDLAAGQSGAITVGATFTSGAGAFAWAPGGTGTPLVVWDFTIELD